MKPRIQLAEATTPDGGSLTLYAHDGQYKILLEGRELMHSFSTYSEYEMGVKVASQITETTAPRYLVGGLGLGYTLKALLKDLPAIGSVTVAELLPAVVEWNRTHLRELNGALLDDPRVIMHTCDVIDLLSKATPDGYDGILLDIDNGPTAMVQAGNQRLYSPAGLALIKEVLAPGGIVAFWSASRDKEFEQRLQNSDLIYDAVPTKAYGAARRDTYMIYYCRVKSNDVSKDECG